MTTAIIVGSYRLANFVRLNVLRCRRLWGEDVPILISDDKSPESEQIAALAWELGCDYACSSKRRSHFSGDAQAIINAIQFGREIGADVALKLSQRLIPVLPEFRTVMEKAFQSDATQIALPGQIPKHQISRPSARFYARFGLLSDIVAIRPFAITPEEFLTVYRARCAEGRHPSDSFVETTLGYLLDRKFSGPKHQLIPEWSRHQHGEPKLYLRKSQSSITDYCQVARMEGLPANVSDWDLREWREIEGKDQYRPKATVV